MKSLLQWAIGLGALGCIGLAGCGGSVDNESTAQQPAAVGIGNFSQSGAGVPGKARSLEPDYKRPTRNLHPVVNCVAPGGENELVAHFGYVNPLGTKLTIPVGSHNAFNPAPFDRGQPTSFVPGESDNVVSVSFHANRGPLHWKLGQARAVARRDSPPCVPSFAGATSATVVSDSEITLTWTAALDYTTPPAGIVFDICMSTT